MEKKKIVCDECGSENFRAANDTILQRQYSFVEKGNLKMCENCGSKYVVCKKCGQLLTRVHLSLDVYGVRDKCPDCGLTNEAIKKWIEVGGGRGYFEYDQ